MLLIGSRQAYSSRGVAACCSHAVVQGKSYAAEVSVSYNGVEQATVSEQCEAPLYVKQLFGPCCSYAVGKMLDRCRQDDADSVGQDYSYAVGQDRSYAVGLCFWTSFIRCCIKPSITLFGQCCSRQCFRSLMLCQHAADTRHSFGRQ